MTNIEWYIMTGLILLGFAGSALYAGMETGAYRINRIRLHILAHQNSRSAARLKQLIDHPTILLSTVLIGTNIMHYIGTAGLAVILEAHDFNPWQVILLDSIILTPLLFVFGEVLPKDLFAVHCDRLMYPLAALLDLSKTLFTVTGFIPLIQCLSGFITRQFHHDGQVAALHPRRQMELLVKEGVGYGLISNEQSAIIERVLDLSTRRVKNEMTPWNSVIKIRPDDPPRLLRQLGRHTERSRFPVVDQRDQVMGILHIIDVLMHTPESCPPVHILMSAPCLIDSDCLIPEALNILQRQQQSLAVVINRRREPVGVVTVKDIVEPITGELKNW